jgi:hypothetical protein
VVCSTMAGHAPRTAREVVAAGAAAPPDLLPRSDRVVQDVIKAAEAHLKTLSGQPGYAMAVLKVTIGQPQQRWVACFAGGRATCSRVPTRSHAWARAACHPVAGAALCVCVCCWGLVC